jgi:hypothetical protein
VALAIGTHLGQIIFDFQRANKLANEAHTSAFEVLFDEVLRFALSLFDGVEEIGICSDQQIEVTDAAGKGRIGQQYCSFVLVETIRAGGRRLAREIYFSASDEVCLLLGDRAELIVATDPVYFRLTAGDMVRRYADVDWRNQL